MKKLSLISLIFLALYSFGQISKDFSVQLNTSIKVDPPSISFSWITDGNAVEYSVLRRLPEEFLWEPVSGSLTASATGWTDTNVIAGIVYEYAIKKSLNFAAYPNNNAFTFVYSGIKVAPTEKRGKLIMLIDDSFATALSSEIEQYKTDLVGDGWIVIPHLVSRTASVTSIKDIIVADYNLDTINTKGLFILGHVPVPYSGNTSYDGHDDHIGAWPTDVFYADVDGIWTDETVDNTGVTGLPSSNMNVPGDGKYDQSVIPSAPGLQVGRVDFANMPVFPLSEQELLRKYLIKNHDYRVKNFKTIPRVLIADRFGDLGGEAPAKAGWKLCSVVGKSNIASLARTPQTLFLTTLETNAYQFAYGTGWGSYDYCDAIGNSSAFVSKNPKTIFSMFFGSYFGDWDSKNNFLKAALASGTILTAVYAGRPTWDLHHMGMGFTIGYSTMKNMGLNYGPIVVKPTYNVDFSNFTLFADFVDINLLGDPTLRMHIIAPPTALSGIVCGNSIRLNWTASPDTVLGYYIYRKDTSTGFYNRISPDIIAGDSFVDTNITDSTYDYMVRAVRLELSACGSYYNLSEGILNTNTVFLGTKKFVPVDSDITIYPNPSSGKFNIRFTSPVAGDSKIEIFDFGGKLVKAKKYLKVAGVNTVPFNLVNFPKGIYLVKFASNKTANNCKLTLE